MSNDVVIRAEGLGKKYLIGHQAERERYTALRDVIARNARNFGRSVRDMFSGRPNIDGDAVEEFWALKDVSFEIKRGEVVGVIGRNGAGKSTLLKILSRITEPSSGRVMTKGRVASLLEVGTGFHPELTGRENIYLNGAILGMAGAEVKRKFDEIVAFAEVERFLDTPVKRYSSGMYVRLAFAVAAHLETEILIIDEVLAVGDSAFQKKCLGKMKSVTGEGRTVLFVSHNMAAVESLCSRCLLLDSGGMESDGSPRYVIERYVRLSNTSCSGAVEFGPKTRERFGPRGIAVLKSLSLMNLNEDHIATVRMGEAVLVRIAIDFKQSGPGFEIGVSVANTHGVCLHYFVSTWEGFHEIDTPGQKIIEMQVPAIHLFPGSYGLSVWVKKQGGTYEDAVHEALAFSVEEAALTPFANYFARYSHNSQVYAPSCWRFV